MLNYRNVGYNLYKIDKLSKRQKDMCLSCPVSQLHLI